MLVALDATEYYNSQKISCPCCLTRQHKNGKVTYHHQALLPVIVSPNQESVISLPPEFITPQGHSQKQDCEQNAVKRWIESHASLFLELAVTVLGDDLYSRQPICQHCLDNNFNFVFVCLPQSHPILSDWLALLETNGDVKTIQIRRRNGTHFEVWHYH